MLLTVKKKPQYKFINIKHLFNSQVEESLVEASNLFESWKRIQQTVSSPKNQELLWTADELNSLIEAIEQDVDDLEEAFQASKADPSQFNLTAKDMNSRRRFLDQSRNSIQNIRNTLANPPAKKKYSQNGKVGLYSFLLGEENTKMHK